MLTKIIKYGSVILASFYIGNIAPINLPKPEVMQNDVQTYLQGYIDNAQRKTGKYINSNTTYISSIGLEDQIRSAIPPAETHINATGITTNILDLTNQDGIVQRLASSEKSNDKESSKEISKLIELKVTTMADEEFVAKYGSSWRQKIEEVVNLASNNFKENFGIMLEVVGYERWNSPDYLTDLHQLFDDSINKIDAKKLNKNSDLIIIFTGQNTPDDIRGTAEHCGNKLIIKDMPYYSSPNSILVLLHELGHIFCAIHEITDLHSIMGPISFQTRVMIESEEGLQLKEIQTIPINLNEYYWTKSNKEIITDI